MMLDPRPEIARPRMNAEVVGAKVQIREPVSKTMIPVINTGLRGKIVNALPKLPIFRIKAIFYIGCLQEDKCARGHATVRHMSEAEIG